MKNSLRITLICILVILILALVGVNIFCVVNKYAKAEEIENNDLVNFNQIIENDFITGGASGSRVSTIDFSTNNIFYVKCDNANNIRVTFWVNNATDLVYEFYMNGNYRAIHTINSSFEDIYIYYSGSSYNNFNMISLSLMYGFGNEPSLTSCEEIFTAEYYPYNSGSPIFQSGLANYNQAINDVFSNYTYHLNLSALGNNTYGVEYQNAEAYFEYRPSPYSNWYFLNTFAVPLFTTLNNGAIVTINYRLYAPNFEGNYYLNIMVYNGTGYSSIYTDPSAIDTTNGNSVSFTLPTSTDTLYFNIVDSNHNVDTEMNMLVFLFDINANQMDVASAIVSANQTGYESARRYYQEEYYNVGGDGYYEIYMEGFRQGQNSDVVSAFDGAWGFISSASSGVASLFQIEILPGLPLATFILVPLMLGLVFFVVKLGKGGGS